MRQDPPRAASAAWQRVEPEAPHRHAEAQHSEASRQPEDAGDTPLMEEIELSVDEPRRQPESRPEPAPQQDASIEDEMSRLLDDLSDERKKEG
jgi:hypothetical protein